MASDDTKRHKTRKGEKPAKKREREMAAAVAGVQTGLGMAMYPLLKTMEGPSNAHDVRQTVERMAGKMGLRYGGKGIGVMTPPLVHPLNFSPAYIPGYATKMFGSDFDGGVVNIPVRSREGIIAHELGHALNDQVLRDKGNHVYVPYRAVETLSRSLGTALVPALAAQAARQEDPNWKPGLTALAVTSPMLAEEAVASIRAGKHLIAEHGVGKGLYKTLPLLPAFGTYALASLSPLGITAWRKHQRAKAKQRKAVLKKTASVLVQIRRHGSGNGILLPGGTNT